MIWLDIAIISLNILMLVGETRKGYIIAFSFLIGMLLTLLSFKLMLLWLGVS